MSIKREDLKVGLKTICGNIVTAIGANWLLYSTEESYAEFRESITVFCKEYTEKCNDEIIEVEVGYIASEGAFCWLDEQGNRIILGKEKITKTGGKFKYNKTTGEFVR